MKSFAFLLVVVAVLVQNSSAQYIRTAAPCGCGASTPVVATTMAQPSVAASLADTLSLLTVSSLLSETLPYNANYIATVPMSYAAPVYAPSYGGCGCGCNSGYGYYY